MKRTMLYLWIFALAAGLAIPAGGSASAAATPSFKVVASTHSIKPNEQLTVKVTATGLPETSAYEIRLAVRTSDGGAASLTPQSQRNLLPGAGFSARATDGDVLKFAYALQGGQSPASGDAELASFAFKGAGAGQVRISLESVQLMDANLAASTYEGGSSVLVTVSDGSSPSSPTPSASPTAGPSDGTPTPTTPSPAPATPSPSPTASPSAGPSASPGPTPAPVVIDLAAEPDADGVAVARPPAERLREALTSARGGTLRIAVRSTAAAGTLAVDLPLAELRGSDLPARIEIDAGEAKLAFDPALLFALTGTDTSSLRVGAGRADNAAIPEAAKARIGGRPVYDLILTADGKSLGSLGDGRPVTVSLPYTAKPDEAPERLVVCFVAEDGSLGVVKHGAYDAASGQISFKPTHFSLFAIVQAPAAFTDLARVPWAQPGIEALAARGLASGVGESMFAPDRHVTRAEFVALLMNVLAPASRGPEIAPAFSDVKPGAWYAGAVSAAAELDIARGRPDGSFGIRDEISRQDMAVMMERALRLAGVRTGADDEAAPTGSLSALAFADSDAIAPYARDAVDALHAAGILTGVGGSRIAPAETATRAQAAVMLYRLYRLL
ncbi:S-layer homology domain-containing protein [Cohnella sp. OV330]|uniref:S-layer homology domain-containing protein n=1 Tax=Cohnella sp. OV330 TaxID=1855288 RepID=UPI0008E87734|nr:S-layer homology domain-containing protein [Cohnella sp. OV330]SFB39323.1 S-layer homology domain-containing protein [Cohnella sp. OV330]